MVGMGMEGGRSMGMGMEAGGDVDGERSGEGRGLADGDRGVSVGEKEGDSIEDGNKK